MKKLLLASAGLFLISQSAIAQNQPQKCGAQSIKERFLARNPQAAQAYAQQRTMFAQQAADYATFQSTTAAKGTQVITVPIVFHIVLNAAQIAQLGGTAGILQRIDSQLAVTNRDFNKQNSDSSQIYTGFKPYYGNAQIQFALAHTDPYNHSTPGYEIITTTLGGFTEADTIGSQDGFAGVKYTSTGGAAAWDPAKYVNVWVFNMSNSGGTVGETMPFSFSDPNIYSDYIPKVEIGVALNYQAFGSRATASQYFPLAGIDGGRTLTHELGHVFELLHVWGDDNGLCPNNGGEDDGIADTPPQANMTYGTPTAPLYDVCTASGNGIMFMNFMDYVDDAYMHMFTKDQAILMQSQLASSGESHELSTHPEILQYPTAVENIAQENNILIAPNPATTNITISLSGNPSPLKNITVVNMMGQQVINISNTSTTNTYNIDLSGLSKGVYFVQCRFEEGMTSRKIVLQ